MDHCLPRTYPHVYQQHRHPRGRHPPFGAAQRADTHAQQRRAEAQSAERKRHGARRQRRARGAHLHSLNQGARAAVRGADQDQARQLRSQGYRQQGHRRRAVKLVRGESVRRADHHRQVHPGIRGARGGQEGARPDPPQGAAGGRWPARQAGRLPVPRPRAE